MHETALPMVSMLHTCLAIHRRWKFLIFLRGQTSSLSALKLQLALIEQFQNSIKHCKYSVKITFSISIQVKCLCGREHEKGVMFISSMVLQWIMTFSSYQQNDQKRMKPQFQWLECCTHVWPSIEDVNFSFFCADKRQLALIEQFQRRA